MKSVKSAKSMKSVTSKKSINNDIVFQPTDSMKEILGEVNEAHHQPSESKVLPRDGESLQTLF